MILVSAYSVPQRHFFDGRAYFTHIFLIPSSVIKQTSNADMGLFGRCNQLDQVCRKYFKDLLKAVPCYTLVTIIISLSDMVDNSVVDNRSYFFLWSGQQYKIKNMHIDLFSFHLWIHNWDTCRLNDIILTLKVLIITAVDDIVIFSLHFSEKIRLIIYPYVNCSEVPVVLESKHFHSLDMGLWSTKGTSILSGICFLNG